MVLLVKAGNVKYAMKRLYVNNEHDLTVARREIQIAVCFLHPFVTINFDLLFFYI